MIIPRTGCRLSSHVFNFNNIPTCYNMCDSLRNDNRLSAHEAPSGQASASGDNFDMIRHSLRHPWHSLLFIMLPIRLCAARLGSIRARGMARSDAVSNPIHSIQRRSLWSWIRGGKSKGTDSWDESILQRLDQLPEEQLYQLGVLMLTGKIPNRPASRSDAFSIWRRVLAQNPNHLNTKFSLGTALLLTPISATATEETIQSVESMKKEGYSLLSEAADGGHAWAMANMAQHLLKQSEVNSSLMRRAANLLTKAWEAGQVPIAPYNLYQLYSTMAKTQVDSQAAESIALSEKWLKIGADKVNDVTSQYQLACALQRRNDDIWVDYMKRAADAGLTMAQHNLAVHLLDKADFSKAMRYFRAASNAGFIHSTFNLGLMYLNGQGLSAPDAASARVYLSQVYVSGDEAMKQQVTEHMDPFSKNSLLS